jgi:hypothetical protein
VEPSTHRIAFEARADAILGRLEEELAQQTGALSARLKPV